MSYRKNLEGGTNHSTHHLLDIREPPLALVSLRNELMHPAHAVDLPYYMKGNSFEESLANIATKCSIVLDGDYDPIKLCDMLCTALRNKRLGIGHVDLQRIDGLMEVEIHEREGEVELIDMEAKRRKEETESESDGPVANKIVLN